jgi:uncharacterized protein (UPF0332 family)
MNETIAAYMVASEECLREAQVLIREHLYRGAAGRCYYAYFNAVRALLATKSVVTKSHSAAHNLFSNYFVKEGPFNAWDAKNLHILFNLRQSSEYDPDELLEAEEVLKAFEIATEFALQTEAYLRENRFSA